MNIKGSWPVVAALVVVVAAGALIWRLSSKPKIEQVSAHITSADFSSVKGLLPADLYVDQAAIQNVKVADLTTGEQQVAVYYFTKDSIEKLHQDYLLFLQRNGYGDITTFPTQDGEMLSGRNSDTGSSLNVLLMNKVVNNAVNLVYGKKQ